MLAHARWLSCAMLALLATGCGYSRARQVEQELAQLQARAAELEAQVTESRAKAERLTSAVQQMERFVGDLDRAVLSASMDGTAGLTDVQAAVSNLKGKMPELRRTADALAEGLRATPEELEW